MEIKQTTDELAAQLLILLSVLMFTLRFCISLNEHPYILYQKREDGDKTELISLGVGVNNNVFMLLLLYYFTSYD